MWGWAAYLVLGFVTGCSPGSDRAGDPPDIRSLTAALDTHRPIEPRLSSFPSHSPCLQDGRSAALPLCGAPDRFGASFHLALSRLAARAAPAAASGDPEALHLIGVIELLTAAAEGNLPRTSIQRLNEAVLLNGGSADLFADLAAAHLVAFDTEGTPAHLLRTMDAAVTALRLEPDHSTARFNLALGMERLGLARGAIREWEAVSESGRSGWAEEAAARRLALSEPSPRFDGGALERGGASPEEIRRAALADPQRARDYAMDRALARWGTVILAGDSVEAREAMAMATHIGEALREGGLDHTVGVQVEVLRTVSAEERARLARLQVGYAVARSLRLAGEFGRARPAFADLEHQMGPRDGPLYPWVLLYHGALIMNDGAMSEAEPRFTLAMELAPPDRFPALAAQVEWVRGLHEARDGFPSRAIPHYEALISFTEAAGESSQLGAAEHLLASARLELGEEEEGMRGLHRVLRLLGGEGPSVFLHTVILNLSELAQGMGLVEGAQALQGEGVAVAAATGRAVTEMEARLRLGRLLLRSGRSEEALRELDRAHALLERVEENSRDWIEADLRLLAGEMLLDGSERERLRTVELLAQSGVEGAAGSSEWALSAAVRTMEAMANNYSLARALSLRARARARWGDGPGASRDLERILAMVAEQEEGREQVAERAALLHAMRPAVQALAAWQLSMGDSMAALSVLDRGRPQVIGDRARESPQEVIHRVPQDEAVVVHAPLGDTMAIWVLRGGEAELIRVPYPASEVASSLARIRTWGNRSRATPLARAELARLHTLLLDPVAEPLIGARVITFLPDESLLAVPFPALLGEDGFLVERAAVRVIPSLEFWETQGDNGPGVDANGAFLVASSPRGTPGLPLLPGVEREVVLLEALGSHVQVREPVGAEGRAELLRALADARVFHFAGHAVSDPVAPFRSALHLDAGPGEPSEASLVTAETLRSLPLSGLRLVVLSACSTLTPEGVQAGGFDGLAGSFLAAGAGGVVGTLWEVEDRSATELVTRFHEGYRDSVDPAGALRAAQLALLHSDDPDLASPLSWGGFRYVGR